MTPTIQEDDRLELSPPTSLTVGAIVVFRHDALLVCHRITAISPQGTLSTSGDATQGACEIVQPASVIGVVTGLMREGTHMSLEQSPGLPSAAAQPTRITSHIRTVVVRSGTQIIRVLARFSFFQHLIAILLRWTATVDVLTPAPLQSLSSHSKVASSTLRAFPQNAELLAPSNGQKPTCYIVRLGPWRLAHYDPVAEAFVLRQSLQYAGLESFIRRIFDERPRT